MKTTIRSQETAICGLEQSVAEMQDEMMQQTQKVYMFSICETKASTYWNDVNTLLILSYHYACSTKEICLC